ncbi:MAG: glycosyl hydrolase [Bacteroidota bacterium]
MRSWTLFVLLLGAAVTAALVFQPGPRLVTAAEAEPPDAIPGPVEPSDWFYRQRAFPEGRIDHDAFVRAQREVTARKTEAVGPDWQFAGPTNVGGRVTSLAVETFDRFYAGTGSGGVFKTTDGGRSYTPVGEGVFSLSIGDVALDPQDPQTVWVGTGESNGGGGSLTYGGSGVYRSADGGQTWEARGLDATGTIGRILVHPADSDRLWVAASGKLFEKDEARGIFHTRDGGASWNRTLAVDDSTGAIDLVINPRSPDTLYAATWTRQRRPDLRRYGGEGSGIWRSADGGETWTRLGENRVGTGLPSGPLGRIGLAVAENRPNVVFAVLTDPTGFTLGTYRSTDGGDTWAALPGANSVSYGWWFGQIRVDPTDWRRVWTPWLDLYRSTDGGASWDFQSGIMHVDHHALWIDPADPNRMIAGNDGGVYRTTAGRSSTVSWTKTPGGFPATQFYTVELDANNPGRIMGGTQDNGTNLTRNGGLSNWEFVFGGDGQYCLFDPVNPQMLYVSFQYGNLFRSPDNGFSFSFITPNDTRANWSAPVLFDPADPEILFYGGTRVWRSTTRGDDWTAISPDLTGGPGPTSLIFGTITTIGVSPADSRRIWAGTDDGRVWTTSDGSTWTNVSAGLPTRWVTRATPHPTDPLSAVVTLSGFRWGEDASRVYRTSDGGATWTDIASGLPDIPANDALYDPADPQRIFLATDVGTFWTRDSGATWDVLGGALPMVPVTDLDLEGRSLVAATYGRGMFRLDLDALVSTDTPPEAGALALTVSPNPARDRATLRVSLARPAEVAVRVFDVRGREALRLPPRALPAGDATLALDLSSLVPGAYLVRLGAEAEGAVARLTVVR